MDQRCPVPSMAPCTILNNKPENSHIEDLSKLEPFVSMEEAITIRQHKAEEISE